MRILLDTNALLWMLTGSRRIEPVRALILADDTELFVSAVSWWEIAIKTRIGKLDADLTELRAAAKDSGLEELALTGRHAETLRRMPRHHNDPFDHMLIAQAMTEPMRFLTGDAYLIKYTPLVVPIP